MHACTLHLGVELGKMPMESCFFKEATHTLEGLMLKLNLQYFGHLMRGVDSLEKTLMLGKIEGRRTRQQRMRWLDGITNSMDMNFANSEKW